MVCSIHIVSPAFIHAKSAVVVYPACTSRHYSERDGVTVGVTGTNTAGISTAAVCGADHK
jgi:hypothetical protein